MKYSRYLSLLAIACLGVSVIFAQDRSEEKEANLCYPDAAERSSRIEKAEKVSHRVQRIEFWGNTTIRDRQLRKGLAFTEGDIFTKDLLIESIESISNSTPIYPIGLDDVKINLAKEGNFVDIIICVKQRQDK